MKKFLKEFKQFAIKGNVVDMAVGVLIGNAFSKIVTSLVNDILTPLLSIIIGKINLTDLSFTYTTKSGNIISVAYGNFLQNVIDFTTMAFCVFIFVKIFSNIRTKVEKIEKNIIGVDDEKEETKLTTDQQLLKEIRDILISNNKKKQI